MGAGRDAVGVFAIEGIQGVKEGFGLAFETEQERGAEDPGKAQVVVVPGRKPVPGAIGEVRCMLDDDARGALGKDESIEAEHAVKGLSQPLLHGERGAEGDDGGCAEDGRRRVGAGGLGQREEPLDERVDRFEAVVVPGQNFGEGAAFVVGSAVAVEGDQRGSVG